MKLMVDALPTDPEECPFSHFVEAVETDVLEELKENGEVEICEDCGGVDMSSIDEEYIHEVYVCDITHDQCGIDKGFQCDGMCVGYVTKF